MKKGIVTLFSLSLLLAFTLQHCPASGPRPGLPPCEPGYQWVEVTTYKEVAHYACKIVPDIKKKWVYKTIDDPFCIPCGLDHGCCCSSSCCPNMPCGTCQGPFPRKLLVKWEIEKPCPKNKCVVEKTVEKIPCTEYRKVPICSGEFKPATFASPTLLPPE